MKYRFFIDDPAVQRVAWQRLYEDIESARLSAAFRMYYWFRPLIPIGVRQRLQKMRKIAAPDGWYLDHAFLQKVADCIGERRGSIALIHPWPGGARSALALTHDVETSEGLRHVPKIAEMEEELGFRSSWNLVPYKYKWDAGLIRDLQSRSFEIGIHGYNHDGRLYCSKRVFSRRALAINHVLQQRNAVGFRSPMVHRNLEWMQQLEIEYDASCFDIDPFQPMPGGVGSIWPFVIGDFVELPTTLPQDHTLFVVLGEKDGRIWHDKLCHLLRYHGMILMLTHPDYLCSPGCLEVYRDFLLTLKETKALWHALPREVARWWRDRDESTLQADSAGNLTIRGPASGRGRIATAESSDGRLLLRHTPRPATMGEGNLTQSDIRSRRRTGAPRSPIAGEEVGGCQGPAAR